MLKGFPEDNHDFAESLYNDEGDRVTLYSSKINIAGDLDNVYNEPHEICSANSLTHNSDSELKNSEDKECFVSNMRSREYYAISWEEIADETDDDTFLSKLRQDLIDNINGSSKRAP